VGPVRREGAPVRCEACGVGLPDDSAYCHGCGRPVAGPLPTLDGEHKPITVVFVDAFGSIGLDERLDAEQWHDVMDSFFSIVSTAVQHFGGTIDRLTGEGIKILFGAPVALESHAAQACHAALHIRDRLGDLTRSFRAHAGGDFAVRMGLASGEVVFGRVGVGGTGTFTSQGHVAALAARLQQLAEPGRIYLTYETATLVADYFDLHEVGELPVRNTSRPVRTYELLAARDDRTRLDVARERGLSPFLGREGELAALEHHLATLGRNESRIVGIVGEPGIGKSRLVEEFLARQQDRALWIQVTRCVEHARWIPFHATIPYLGRLLGLSGEGDVVATRDRITRAVLAVDPALAESLPILFTVMGVADEDEASRATGSSAPTREIANVMRRFTEHGSDGRPLIFVVDDQQWMDTGTEGVLGDLVAEPPRAPCLVVVTYRRGHRRRWMRAARFSEMALRPLDDASMRTLVRVLLGDDRSVADTSSRILARAGGNPYFVEEIVRALVDSGALAGEPGRYRVAHADVPVTVPGSLHAALASRVDQLGVAEKAVLQTAAVVGREFSSELLGRLLELAPDELARRLGALEAADFVHGFGWGAGAMFAFRHPLLRETVYRGLLGDQRRRIHAAIVEQLTSRPDASSGLVAAQIAPHAEAAGDSAAAARWHAKAARHTAEWDPVQGLEHWRRVLANTNSGPLDGELAALRLAACEAVVRLGFHQTLPTDESMALITEGDALAARLGDQRAAAFLTSARGNVRVASGDVAGARALHEAAYVRTARAGDHEASLRLAARLVLTERMAGLLRPALARADAALAASRDMPVRRSITLARHHLELARITVLLDLGQPAAGGAELAAVTNALRRENAPAELAWALAVTVFQMRHTGDVSPQLARRVEEARALAGSSGVPGLLAHTATALSVVRILQRRWAAARQLALEALDVPFDLSHPFYCGVDPSLQLSCAHAGLGEYEHALELAERALERACARGSVIGQMDGLFATGRLLRRSDHPAERERGHRFLQHGLALARATGSLPRLPLFLMELPAVARQAGDERGAQARKRRAVHWLSRVDAVGFVRRLTEGLEG
jgi:adenylate cyclase